MKHNTRIITIMRLTALVLAAVLVTQTAATQTVLTREDTRRRALEFNRAVLSAEQDVKVREAEVKYTLADALPQVTLGADYNRNIKSPSFFFFDNEGNSTEIKTATDNSFDAYVTVRQPIWQGGKVFTAYAISKLYKKYSEAVETQVRDQVVEQADALFFAVALQRANLKALESALENNTANLDVVEKKYEQGLVSEFEVLRARVERSNLLPQIIAAESAVDLAEKNLRSFLGIDLNESIEIVEAVDDTSLAGLPSRGELTASALESRPEVIQSLYVSEIARKAIRVARGGYFPNVDAVSNYTWQAQADDFTTERNNARSWTAGIAISYPIFEGGRTRAEVGRRKAEYNQARLHVAQVRDDVRLEVEAAYDQLLQAKKSLDVQGQTIAQAEEGLRIARLRFDSGVGTQLEILSAQTALTQARRSLAGALYSFRIARAGLTRTSTVDIDSKLEQ